MGTQFELEKVKSKNGTTVPKKEGRNKKAALEAPLLINDQGVLFSVRRICFGCRRRSVLLTGDFRTCAPATARTQMKPRFVGVALRRIEIGRLAADRRLGAEGIRLGLWRVGGDGVCWGRGGGSRGDSGRSGDESWQARRDGVKIHAGLFLSRRRRRIEAGLLIAEVLPALALLIEAPVIARLAFLTLAVMIGMALAGSFTGPFLTFGAFRPPFRHVRPIGRTVEIRLRLAGHADGGDIRLRLMRSWAWRLAFQRRGETVGKRYEIVVIVELVELVAIAAIAHLGLLLGGLRSCDDAEIMLRVLQ
jgi:hypothetical protein